MVVVYGADLSSPSNKVRYVLNDLGVEYVYKRVSIKNGENKTEDFLSRHPAGKIPAVDDDGFVLFESNAIIKYFARKHASELYPADPKDRAKVDQWMDFISIHIGGAMDKIVYNKIFAPVIGVEVD